MGVIQVDYEKLPDNTYELCCLNCGNRVFPTELVVTVNMLITLKRIKIA